MRSVSAFVNPAAAVIATTTASATAASAPRARARSVPAAIGSASIAPHATGEPNAQNASGRTAATPLR